MVSKQVNEHLDQYPNFKDLSGKKVLIKVNLLSASTPEKMITTHPVFVKALVEEVRSRGGSVIIGDSPGGLFNEDSLKKCYRESGLQQVSDDTGALLNLNTKSHKEQYLQGSFTKAFQISDYIRDCDLIIAAPKIKTHMFCGLTCASKIMFGAIPGTEKVRYHTRFPDAVAFSKMLLDLTDMCKVDLFMVDGIVGMDGNGPAGGNPRDIGLIISGKDHLGLDLHVCRLTGLDPERMPIMYAARESNLLDFNDTINITGPGKTFKLSHPFEHSSKGGVIGNLPKPLKRLSVSLTTAKPIINRRSCVGCGVCRDNCAGSAIMIVKEKAYIDYSKCIRCFCCHELCPHNSVDLRSKDPKLLRKLIRIAGKLIPRRK